LKVSGKFCPICKNKNARTALFCKYCGALLDENFTNIVATAKNIGGQPNAPVENIGSLIDAALIPEGGIGVYVVEALKPYYLPVEGELIIGREKDSVSEPFLNLSELDAFNMGLSRRHAMIRRIESGYEVIDLASTNGTWLNQERLNPNKPYPFPSGSQIRLGRMRIFVMYHTVLKGMKNK
jgi:FHA domain